MYAGPCVAHEPWVWHMCSRWRPRSTSHLHSWTKAAPSCKAATGEDEIRNNFEINNFGLRVQALVGLLSTMGDQGQNYIVGPMLIACLKSCLQSILVALNGMFIGNKEKWHITYLSYRGCKWSAGVNQERTVLFHPSTSHVPVSIHLHSQQFYIKYIWWSGTASTAHHND